MKWKTNMYPNIQGVLMHILWMLMLHGQKALQCQSKTIHVIKNQNHRAATSLTWMTCLAGILEKRPKVRVGSMALDTTKWHVNLCDSTWFWMSIANPQVFVDAQVCQRTRGCAPSYQAARGINLHMFQSFIMASAEPTGSWFALIPELISSRQLKQQKIVLQPWKSKLENISRTLGKSHKGGRIRHNTGFCWISQC